MYGMVNNGQSRLPKVERHADTSMATSALSKTVGTALLQAAAIVVVAKIVDVAVESFVNRRRERQQPQAPQRRREEAVA